MSSTTLNQEPIAKVPNQNVRMAKISLGYAKVLFLASALCTLSKKGMQDKYLVYHKVAETEEELSADKKINESRDFIINAATELSSKLDENDLKKIRNNDLTKYIVNSTTDINLDYLASYLMFITFNDHKDDNMDKRLLPYREYDFIAVPTLLEEIFKVDDNVMGNMWDLASEITDAVGA